MASTSNVPTLQAGEQPSKDAVYQKKGWIVNTDHDFHDRQDGCKYGPMKKLAAGGYGVVYRTTCRRGQHSGEECALKSAMGYAPGKRSLMNELRARDKCGMRDNIVPLWDVLWDGRTPVAQRGHPEGLVMPYYSKGSLRHYVQDEHRCQRPGLAPFPEISHILWFFWNFINGLKHVHDCGLVHNDIKEDNILLDGSFKCAIADFGECLEARQMHAGAGTGPYMAPEALKAVMQKRLVVSMPWHDIWSAGVAFFACLSSRPIYCQLHGFNNLSREQKLAALLKDCEIYYDLEHKATQRACAHPPAHDSDLWQQFLQILQACLKKNPKKRPTARGLQKRARELYEEALARVQARLQAGNAIVNGGEDPESSGARTHTVSTTTLTTAKPQPSDGGVECVDPYSHLPSNAELVGPNHIAVHSESTMEVVLPSEVGLTLLKNGCRQGGAVDWADESSPFGAEGSLRAESLSPASHASSPWGSPPPRQQRAHQDGCFDRLEPVHEWDAEDAALQQAAPSREQAIDLKPEAPPQQKAWRPRSRRPRVLTPSQQRAARKAGASEERIAWFLRKSSSERKRLHKKHLWLQDEDL